MISLLFKKLNFKSQKRIVVINAPDVFESELKEMAFMADIKNNIDSINEDTMFIAFVQRESEVIVISKSIMPLIESDSLVWFAYPKKSSKKYNSEINRDSGWEELGNMGLEGVRAVAIDEDWSALRFRHVDSIKTLTRSSKMMLSEEGKEKKAN